MEDMQSILVGTMALAPAMLCGLGMLLKNTPKVPNWTIPWILTLVGIVAGIVLNWGKGTTVDWVFKGIAQGIVAAAMSQWGYQMWKQVAVDRKKS